MITARVNPREAEIERMLKAYGFKTGLVTYYQEVLDTLQTQQPQFRKAINAEHGRRKQAKECTEHLTVFVRTDECPILA